MENSDDLFLSRVNLPIASVASLPDYRLSLTRVHLVNARLTAMDDILPLHNLTNLCLKVCCFSFFFFFSFFPVYLNRTT
jgi:hypothetical protein